MIVNCPEYPIPPEGLAERLDSQAVKNEKLLKMGDKLYELSNGDVDMIELSKIVKEIAAGDEELYIWLNRQYILCKKLGTCE